VSSASQLNGVFVTVSYFHHSLIFSGKTVDNPTMFQALHRNIRLGWK